MSITDRISLGLPKFLEDTQAMMERLLTVPANRLLAFIGLLGFWFLLRPFDGFYHDAFYYAFDAIGRFTPGLLANDLFSKYFDQGAASLFPYIQAPFIHYLGLWHGTYLLFVITQVIWFVCAYYLASVLFKSYTARYALLVCLAAATGFYLTRVFRIDEPFVTARSLAEPLALVSITELLRRRDMRCLLWGIAAMAMHPLLGVWGPALLAGVWVVERGNAWLFLRLLLIVAVTIAVATWLFDDHRGEVWLNMLNAAKVYMFPLSWRWEQWDRLLQQLLIVLCGCLISENRRFRSFCLVLLAGTAACMLLSIWGDAIRSLWLIKLQAWRINYIVYIFALAVTVDVALRYNESYRFRVLAFALIMSWASRDYSGSLLAAVGVVAVLMREQQLKPLLQRYGTSLLWLALGTVGLIFVFAVMTTVMWYNAVGDGYAYQMATSEFNTAFLFLFIVLTLAAARWLPRMGFAMFFLLGVSVSYAHNKRPQYDPGDAVRTIREHVKPGEVMYWPGNIKLVWLYAHRPFYFNGTQITPSIFDKQIFYEALRRISYLGKAGLLSPYYTEVDKAHYDTAPMSDKRVGAASWQHICSDPVLKWVVMAEDGNDDFKGYPFRLQGHEYKLISCQAVLATRRST